MYAATSTQDVQRRQDEEHLRLLALFHYIWGAATAIFACFGLIHFFVGLAMLNEPGGLLGNSVVPPNAPPTAVLGGLLFAIIGGLFVLLGWTLGGLTIYAGRCIAARKKHGLIFVTACLNCLNMPVGTALGVFTLVVLSRPTVKVLFDTWQDARARAADTSYPADRSLDR